MYIRHLPGSSDVPVVFLHGFLETGAAWLPWVEGLGWDTHLFIPDLPGHGRTVVWSENTDFSDWARGLFENIQRQVKNFRRLQVIGHSMGGYLALEMAALFPDQMEKLILFHSTPFPDTPQQITRRQKQIELIKQGRSRLLIRNVGGSMFAPHHRHHLENLAQELNHQAHSCSDLGMLRTLNAIMNRRNFVPILERMAHQTLFISGGCDPFMPEDHIRSVTERFPALHAHHFPSAGHASFLEQPAEARSVVDNFTGNGTREG